MSDYSVCVDFPTVIGQWLRHDLGGGDVLVFPKGSAEHRIMELFLVKQPEGFRERTSGMRIALPYFRHKDPRVYNHLPERATRALVDTVSNRMMVELWNELHHFGSIGKRRDELLYAWMEAHGIELTETAWNFLAKRYQRMQRTYEENRRRAEKKNE